jgi:hypothetical protein
MRFRTESIKRNNADIPPSRILYFPWALMKKIKMMIHTTNTIGKRYQV